jgi:hypothetical protein
MDLAITFNLTHKQLHSIKMCRIFLQVLALSGITAADGESILQPYYAASKTRSNNNLTWPVVPHSHPTFHVPMESFPTVCMPR